MKISNVSKSTQFAVLGLGKFGRSVVRTLHDNGYDVLCCDIDEHLVEEAAEYSTYAIQGDVTDELVLEKIGIRNMDIVIIALSTDFEASIITTMIVKDMGVNYVMAKASGPRQKRILESIGVNRVVLPEKEIGEKVAYGLITNNLLDYIHNSEEYNIVEVSPKPSWIGKTLKELKLRQTEDLNIIALIKNDEITAVIDPEVVIHADDSLVVLKIDN